MNEDILEDCPVLYLGQILNKRLCGGWSSRLPQELCLYFGSLYPQDNVCLFISRAGIIIAVTPQCLELLSGWRQVLDSSFLPDCQDVTLCRQLADYFGIKITQDTKLC